MANASGAHQTRPQLSIVSPVYGCAKTVSELIARCRAAAQMVADDWEIILVDDGSPDDAWTTIEREARADPRVRGVRLSRNFGQNPAITAGLAASAGDLVVVIDCDLQDDPTDITRLVERAHEGFDIVFTMKTERNHSPWRNVAGRAFHWLLNALITEPAYRTESRIGSYSLITRPVVDAFLELKDTQRHYLSLLRWLGFRSTFIPVDHQERKTGKSSYTVGQLIREAVVGITSQSERPLHLAVTAGFLFVAASMLGVGGLLTVYITDGFLAGWTSTVVLLLLCTGMILVALGVTGIYVGKTLEQSRGRPLYVVMDRTTGDASPSGATNAAADHPVGDHPALNIGEGS